MKDDELSEEEESLHDVVEELLSVLSERAGFSAWWMQKPEYMRIRMCREMLVILARREKHYQGNSESNE